MHSEIGVLKRANPIQADEALAWMESEGAHHAHTRLVDAVDNSVGSLEPTSGTRWSRSSWLVAASAAAAVLLIVALPLALLRGDTGEDLVPASSLPVHLGVEHVWPDSGRGGSPADVASAFAIEVLGWDEATVHADDEADATGPVWVLIGTPGRDDLSVLTAPALTGGLVLMQVGTSPLTGSSGSDDPASWWISLQHVPGAVGGYVSMRPIDSHKTLTVEFDSTAIEAGRITDTGSIDIREVATLLIRYLDAEGSVITASGGHGTSGELDEQELTPTSQSGTVPEIPSPTTGEDPFGLIADTGWGNEPSVRPPSDFAILDSSSPTKIDLLVFDNSCGPVVVVDAVTDAPEAGLQVTMTSMDDLFGEAGFQCTDLSIPYVVAVTLTRPVDIESLTINWNDQRTDP